MVFDMISNAPGVLNSNIQWGRLADVTGGASDPYTTLSLNPTAYNFVPPRVNQWNVGIQQKLPLQMVYDIAYIGSKSTDILRQSQINAVPLGATFEQQNQDPTRAPSTKPGATALPNDFLRPYAGYGNIRMWGYDGYSNYHGLQTSLTRRFDKGYMFSVFYVWSKTLTIANDDFTAGAPFTNKDEIKRLDYSYASYDRPHNFVMNAVYQVPKFAEGATGILLNEWQLSGVYRWTSGRPYAIGYSIPGYGSTNLTGNDGNPGARIALTCDPGKGYSGDPYHQIDNTNCFAPPQPGSDGAESARFFMDSPPISNLDMSISKRFSIYKETKFEFRLDMFNALNHTQFTGVNATANFASLTDHTITNLGSETNKNGFGTINGVAPPRTLQLVARFTF
jgi:hypothetical protein